MIQPTIAIIRPAKVLVGARRAAHPSKATAKMPAIHGLIDDLTDDGPPEALLPFINIIINLLEAVKMIFDEELQGGIARIGV